MRRLRRALAIVMATLALGAFHAACFAGDSATVTGKIGSVSCSGTVSYTNTTATAVTRIYANSGSATVNVMSCCRNSDGSTKKHTYGSGSDSIVAEARAYNEAGTVIVGARGTYNAYYGAGSWSYSNTTGSVW